LGVALCRHPPGAYPQLNYERRTNFFTLHQRPRRDRTRGPSSGRFLAGFGGSNYRPGRTSREAVAQGELDREIYDAPLKVAGRRLSRRSARHFARCVDVQKMAIKLALAMLSRGDYPSVRAHFAVTYFSTQDAVLLENLTK
jgi:hypothetical protein